MTQPPPSGLSALPSYPSSSVGDQNWIGPGRGRVIGFAVASLVLGAVGGILLSVIFGLVALNRIRHLGYRGRGLAIAGLTLSGTWIAVIGT